MKKQINKITGETRSLTAGQKTLEGIIVSVKMQKTVVVKIQQFLRHPMYKKLIRKDRKIKADAGELTLSMGDRVKIGETRPLSSTKHFRVLEVIEI